MTYNTADDLIIDHSKSLFSFHPTIKHSHVLEIIALAEGLGYTMLNSDRGFTLQEVQEKLRLEGPGSFLRIVALREDIWTRKDPGGPEDWVVERLEALLPLESLTITDPYLLHTPKGKDAQSQIEIVIRVLSPLLIEARSLTLIVLPGYSDDVATAVLKQFQSQDLNVQIIESQRWHDRFWLADKERGVVMGTSLSGLGRKIFLMDTLTRQDLDAVLEEVQQEITTSCKS